MRIATWRERAERIPRIRFETIDTKTMEFVCKYLYYRQRYNSTPADKKIEDFNIDIQNLLSVVVAAHYLDV